MGLDPISIATIGSAALGLGGSLFGKKKQKTEYASTKSPQAQGLENSINQYYQSMMGRPSPYVPMNSMSLNAANILSNAYGGGPYTQYGMQSFNPQGMQGQPQRPPMPNMPPSMGGAPQGGMPGYLPQMMSGGLYGGGNIPRQRQ
jgi:hypothetical protein